MKKKFYLIVINLSGRHRTTRRLIFGDVYQPKSRFSDKYNSLKEAQKALQDCEHEKYSYYISNTPINNK